MLCVYAYKGKIHLANISKQPVLVWQDRKLDYSTEQKSPCFQGSYKLLAYRTAGNRQITISVYHMAVVIWGNAEQGEWIMKA
jgi:hypothetical protein